MRRYCLILAIYACLLTALMLALPGCAANPAAYQPLVNAVQGAAADGIISEAELGLILQQLPGQGPNWGAIAMGVASIAGSLLGVKLLPSRVLQGPFDPKPSQPA